MTYISRIAEHYLIEGLEEDKVLIVYGPRQVGKTTIVTKLCNPENGYNAIRYDMDNVIERARVENAMTFSPADAMRELGNPQVLVIDEAQQVKGLPLSVKSWYDAKVPTKIILTGTATLQLRDKAAEVLTGRYITVNLTHLAFSEVLEDQGWYKNGYGKNEFEGVFKDQVQALLLRHMVYGGYPGALASGNPEAFLIQISKVNIYRDVLSIGSVREPDIFRRLLQLLAYHIGSEVNPNELAMKLGVDRRTVERCMDLLEDTFIIFTLSSYGNNQRKEIVKGKKVYFWDAGIRNALIGDFSLNMARGDMGHLFENVMIAEFKKAQALRAYGTKLYFWRSLAQSEVDLVLTLDGSIFAYEMKLSRPSRFTGRGFTNHYSEPVDVITKDNAASKVIGLIK